MAKCPLNISSLSLGIKKTLIGDTFSFNKSNVTHIQINQSLKMSFRYRAKNKYMKMEIFLDERNNTFLIV